MSCIFVNAENGHHEDADPLHFYGQKSSEKSHRTKSLYTGADLGATALLAELLFALECAHSNSHQ